MSIDTSALVEGIVSSTKASIAVILVLIYGYLIRRWGLVSQEGESNISKLGTSVFLPCLLFSEIGPLATASNIASYWPIIPFSLVFQLISLVVGLASQKIFKLPHYYVPMFVFNNVTSLPLLLVQSLSKTGTFDDLLQPDETMDQLVKRGTVYILINALVGNMTRFALGPYLMKAHEPWTWLHPFSDDPHHKHHWDVLHESDGKLGPIHFPTTTTDSASPDEEDGPQGFMDIEGEAQPADGDGANIGQRKSRVDWKAMGHKLWTGLKTAANPPLVGGVMGILCGIIPIIHKWLFEQGWLSPLSDSIDDVGGLYTALQMFVLGAHLYSKKGSRASIPTLVWLFLWRFFLISGLSIAAVWGIRKGAPGLMINDPMLDFVLMNSNVGPPALTLSAVASMAHLDSDDDGAVSRIITLSYAVTPLIALPVTAALQFAGAEA